MERCHPQKGIIMLHQQDLNKEGSFFCEKCEKEYDQSGRCKCKGRIVFVNIDEPTYIRCVMNSKKRCSNKPTLSYARIYERDPNSKEDIKWL